MNFRLLPFLLLLLAGALPASAGWWNPFSWFDKKDYIVDMAAATPEEQAEAAELFRQGLEEFRQGKFNRAENKFERIVDKFERTRVAPDALLHLALIKIEEHQYTKAFKTTQSVLFRYPDYEGFNLVIRTQFEIATLLMQGARGRILWVIPSWKTPEKSREYYEAMLRNAPYSDYAPMALMNITMVSRDQGDREYAIDALDRLINFYPNTQFGADAYFLLADIFASMVDGPEYDQGSTQEAINFFEDYLILYPQHQQVSQAEIGLREMREVYARSKYLIGEFYYLHRNNTTAALVFYNETITVAPNSEAAVAARERIDRVRTGMGPPRSGLGLRQLYARIRGGAPEKTPEQVAREREELGETATPTIQSDVIPAPLPGSTETLPSSPPPAPQPPPPSGGEIPVTPPGNR